MNCIGIWISNQQDQQTHELECHFNLWMLKSISHKQDEQLDCFLDIGFKFNILDKSSHINIFLPDKIDKSNLQDLGIIFKDNAGLVSAVFNEDYGVLTHANEKTIEIQQADKTPLFDIYMLDLENDVSISPQFGGSTISIHIPEHLKAKTHYYRIRLKCAFVDKIGYIYNPPASSILEGAFFQTELIDFRVNENRILPDSLLETIRKNGAIKFKKTHFFLMREASDDYIFSHKPPGGRQLERDTWKAYVGKDYSFEQITAYHWKEATLHDSFSVFAKFRSFHSGWRTILIAIGAIVILGIISGFLGNLFYSLID
ncbi:hypothetical protein ACFLVH_05195 [Chloroflexota bacterium]